MTTDHTTAQKIQYVRNWRTNGLTRLQYCRLHAISPHALHEWLSLPGDELSLTQAPALLPVRV